MRRPLGADDGPGDLRNRHRRLNKDAARQSRAMKMAYAISPAPNRKVSSKLERLTDAPQRAPPVYAARGGSLHSAPLRR